MHFVVGGTSLAPDGMLRLPGSKRFKELTATPVDRESSCRRAHVVGRLFGILFQHVSARKAGWLFPRDTPFQCFPPDGLRTPRPDVSFVRWGRLPNNHVPEGSCPATPDLVAEVFVQRPSAALVEQKVTGYFAAGVRHVWMIDLESRVVLIPRDKDRIAMRRAEGELTGEEVLPEFACPVAELFAGL